MKAFFLLVALLGLCLAAPAQTTLPLKVDADSTQLATIGLHLEPTDAGLITDRNATGTFAIADSSQSVYFEYENHTAVVQDSLQVYVLVQGSRWSGWLMMHYHQPIAPKAKVRLYTGTPVAFGATGRYYLTVFINVCDRKTTQITRVRRRFVINNTHVHPKKAPLPVTLAQFSAAAVGTGVRVDWRTALEVNASHFIVQRSESGTRFTDLTQVRAKGASAYHATDPLPFAAGTYYRLLSVDLDGTSAYSPVVFVKGTTKGNEVLVASFDRTQLYPVTAATGGTATHYEVRDLSGRLVLRQPATGRLDTQLHTAGVYLLTLVGHKGIVGSTKILVH